MSLFPYDWRIADGYPAKGVGHHGAKVFGTFVCGGGSTMGYKLAGYDHRGGVEIDPKIAAVYKANHTPAHLYVEDIRAFNARADLPEELYNLDLLDGSPPCSSFSMAGSREKDWGKSKVFSEGQQKQRLDDLVFEYIKTIEKLQPKVALLENVKGLIMGNAKSYAKKLKVRFEEAGYRVQVFLLNAASMGVPQRRERVFFIGLRKNIKAPPLKLAFKGESIPFSSVDAGEVAHRPLSELARRYWRAAKPGDSVGKFAEKKKVVGDVACGTLTAQGVKYHHKHCRELVRDEIIEIGSYPTDYGFLDVKPSWLVGMSVPPVMAAQIAHQINIQWLRATA